MEGRRKRGMVERRMLELVCMICFEIVEVVCSVNDCLTSWRCSCRKNALD